MAGIYLHIPFCKQACFYCDFHFSTNHQVKGEMVKALIEELHLQHEYLGGEEISSIYLGGGTPSLLTTKELSDLLDTIHKLHSVNQAAEITLEANPDDLKKSTLENYRTTGVNRLSIGIQSFQDDLLGFLNRAHDSSLAMSSFQLARDAGFQNVSIDLIYAIPGLENSRWASDINQAISLAPEHISCYSLTIEEKTAFGRWAAAGKLKPAEEEISAQHLELLIDKLEAEGYEHYEISNFSKPGFHSQHNSSYWKQEKYLGIGPSAHSYNRITRQNNVRNNHLYLKAINNGTVPSEVEILSSENKINEYILTTLRTNWGTDLAKLKADFGYNLRENNSAYIQQLLTEGLATLQQQALTLTRKGKLLADKIASDLFVLKHDH
ncbi:MAG: radical SAM family heme chaperone HemW [Cyclobacteriaceae bacterium]|nr:radical SAM family heme chaperone HemW [Cyclobacteriaceae bacterium]